MSSQPLNRFIPAAFSAWLSFVILDFLVHAIFLASWWRNTESYWHPPATLFKMIPIGYASFAIYCATFVWLQLRLLGPRPGILPSLRLGAIVGMAVGSFSVLATYSVFRMPPSALLVWPASLLVESLGAAIAASVVTGANRPWHTALMILVLAFLLFGVGVALQSVIS